jgi:2-polyprenyl-3-methyl-5-hydroxy-6-metoxy-1,4-benzoquinol methylase
MADEIAAMIAEIRQRVQARNPNGKVLGDIPLVDLMPLIHARDAAEGKVASIGMVNPRPPGLSNSIAQWMKRMVSRALDWHVREQVEFNRAAIACVQSTIESLNESNRAISALAAKIDALDKNFSSRMDEFGNEARELKDIRAHWVEWRVDWEKKLSNNEIQFLRSVAELQSSFNYRVTLMDQNYREQVKARHSDFEGALQRATKDIQQRVAEDLQKAQKQYWEDMRQLRVEYDAIIHAELRVFRQKMSFAKSVEQLVVPSAPSSPDFQGVDWLRFADRFRGSESAVQERQRLYAERFRGMTNVLDIGCGRGEMLEVFRDAGIGAQGIDLHDDSIALCLSKGLRAEKADLFTYLESLADGRLEGIVCSQVVEHLPPERMPEMIRLAQAKLRPRGLLAIETPNPECLAIFATHFYIDPTHRHPIPPALLTFYVEEAGFGRIEVERLSPAIETMPSIAELPEKFRQEFFGALDYALFASKL